MSTSNSARSLLDAAYKNLELSEGELLPATDSPELLKAEQWIEKGEWLSLAKYLGAEKIFFVRDNPVIVFATVVGGEGEALRLFNRVWCMARPSLLFIAREGDLAVYKLATAPLRSIPQLREQRLDFVSSVTEVAEKLKTYRREQVESGRLYEDSRFGDPTQRADQSLIRDLRIVRSALMQQGLTGRNLRYAHALIARSIFIRYLEDRGVLTRTYFKQVAGKNRGWLAKLQQSPILSVKGSKAAKSLYLRVLSDHEFSYALFDRLAQDFNGDMFPSDQDESRIVTQKHLSLLQLFLLGDVGPQQQLFLWAYQFDIVPVELISSIYEEFYHSQTSDVAATHYTPSALVDFILSKVLTPERLTSNPRILDPACGSGIFLVEAFRRIVRHKIREASGQKLNASELREILRTQIAGIDLNGEAIQVAAFSLYLALLHYLEPRDIVKQIQQKQRLPHLIHNRTKTPSESDFNILLCENTFKVAAAPPPIDRQTPPDEEYFPYFAHLPADIVVGNPPWGTTTESNLAIQWCKKRELSVGDEELSQAFVWKSLDLLSPGGSAALLVSTGVLFKHHPKSVQFRRQWLTRSKIIEVVNFAHVRDIFFHSGVAPFASVILQKSTEITGNVVRYWSAKHTAQADHLQAVVLSNTDMHWIPQDDLIREDRLWKVYWWGNSRDRALINWLEMYQPLANLQKEGQATLITGQGFKERGTKVVKKNGKRQTVPDQKPASWLKRYKYLPTRNFQRYGALEDAFKKVPATVHRRGVREVYEGQRLLIKRGISQSSGAKGQIIARLESAAFCFRNSIHGIKLKKAESWEYKVLLGIFWSSLARYYFFLTSSTWGMWHYELHLEEIERMPICLPNDLELRNRIVTIVDSLRSVKIAPKKKSKLTGGDDAEKVSAAEDELDDSIFDLYQLSEPERDQVRDMCNVGIDFFYNSYHSDAAKPLRPIASSQQPLLFPTPERDELLHDYAEVFLDIWNQEGRASNISYNYYDVFPGADSALVALLFSQESKTPSLDTLIMREDLRSLQSRSVLQRLENALLLVPHDARTLYIDGLVRAVTPSASDILIMKRNEKRLWTRSMAREDAEATIVQALRYQESQTLS